MPKNYLFPSCMGLLLLHRNERRSKHFFLWHPRHMHASNCIKVNIMQLPYSNIPHSFCTTGQKFLFAKMLRFPFYTLWLVPKVPHGGLLFFAYEGSTPSCARLCIRVSSFNPGMNLLGLTTIVFVGRKSPLGIQGPRKKFVLGPSKFICVQTKTASLSFSTIKGMGEKLYLGFCIGDDIFKSYNSIMIFLMLQHCFFHCFLLSHQMS